MKMIYKYIYVTLCAVALAFLGCTEYEEVVDPPFVLPFDKIEASGTDTTEKRLHFGSSSSSYQYSVTADVEWINISSEGFAAWNIIIPQNETVFERKGTITVMVVDGYFGAKYSQTIKVTQSKGEARAETNVLQFSADGGGKYLLIKTNLPNYKISVDKSWVTLGKSNGEGGENGEEVWVNVSTNPNNSSRSATISIQSGQSKLPVATITQEAMTYVWDVLSGNDYTVNKYNEVVLEADEYAKSYTVAIRTNLSWKCSITSSSGNLGSDWVTVETPKCDVAMSSSATTTYLKFKLDDNRDYRRQVVLKVSATNNSGKSAYIYINQDAIPHLSLVQESVQLGASAGGHSMSLGAGADWSATCDADWLTLTNSSGTLNDRTLNFSVSKNTTEPKRTATIKITLDEWPTESVELVVTQIRDDVLYYTLPKGTASQVTLYGATPFDTAITEHVYDSESGEGYIAFAAPPTTIGDDAFSGSGIITVTLPTSIREIGSHAFLCSSLEGVYISDLSAWCKILFISNYGSNPLYYAKNLYLNGQLVTDLVIPSDIDTINWLAFNNCDSLITLTIPDNVREVQWNAFSNCDNLSVVTIGNGITEMLNNVFSGCPSLTEFRGKWASADKRCLIIDGTLHAFARVGVTEYDIPSGVTAIGPNVFTGCKDITRITIPDGVVEIGGGAFSDCRSLKTMTIPNSVTSIGGAAFFNCNSLEEINLGNSLTKIGSQAFCYCDSLTSITIPDSVTTIEYDVFRDCSNLQTVIIGSGVKTMGEDVFSYCKKLENVYCKPATPPSVGPDMFNKCTSLHNIYVPTNSVNAYKSADVWQEYADKIVGATF